MRQAAGARPRFRVGLLLAVVYAVAAVAHVRFGGTARPLFDGFAPPPPYRWVDPPREFAAGNQPPKPTTIEVPLGPTGSPVTSGSSGDGQVILSFPAGAFPAHPPDTKVLLLITPVDPAALAPPPAGLAPDGNAYRLDATYDPSKALVPALAVPSDIFLVVPEPAQTLLFSPDGRTWENLTFRPVPDPTQIGGSFTGPGYLLAVAPPVGRPSEISGGDDSAGLLPVVAVTALLALVLGLAPVAWRSVRGR